MMKFHLFLLLFLQFILASCCHGPRLSVQTQFINHDYLASSYVNTPDFRQNEPYYGQRLVVQWVIPKRDFVCGEFQLQLRLRFHNHSQKEVLIPISYWQGTYVYSLLNEDYKESTEIITYQVNLIRNGAVIQTWNHPLWSEMLSLEI